MQVKSIENVMYTIFDHNYVHNNPYLDASYFPYLVPPLIYLFHYQKNYILKSYLFLHVILHLYSRNTVFKSFVYKGLKVYDSVPLISFFGGSDSFDNDL